MHVMPIVAACGSQLHRTVADRGPAQTARQGESWREERQDVRVLVNEGRNIVDLVMHNHIQILLGGVRLDLLDGEFLVCSHGVGSV